MDKNRECCMGKCRRCPSVGRLCAKHAGEKFLIRLKLSFEEIFGSLEEGQQGLKGLLPEVINVKHLADVLSFFQVSYNAQDLENVIKIVSADYGNTIKVTELIERLKKIGQKDEEIDSFEENSIEENCTVEELKIFVNQELSPSELFRKETSDRLQKKFISCENAFLGFANSKKIGFFQLMRMFEYLEMPLSERAVKDFLLEFSKKVRIKQVHFKKIWHNNDRLCLNEYCVSEFFQFGYCKSHLSILRAKGKVLLNQIFNSLNWRVSDYVKRGLSSIEDISKKSIKNFLSAYTGKKLTNKDCKNIAFYVISKKQKIQAEEIFFQNNVK